MDPSHDLPSSHPPSPSPCKPVQVMFVAFAVASALWGALLLRSPSQRHALHHLMSALVVAKTLTLLSQAGMYHYIRATGSPDGWNIAFYIFTFLRGLLFFTVRIRSSLDLLARKTTSMLSAWDL